MKNIIYVIILSVTIFSCNNSNSIKLKELELKEKELELKEKELELKKSENFNNENKSEEKTNSKLNKQKKELRHLLAANGGMIAYFNDGTIVECPRCDFCKTNIESMFNTTPSGTYDASFNPYDDGKVEDWVLVDYEWVEKVPQW